MKRELTFLTRRSSCYSAAAYLFSVLVSVFLAWLGLQLAILLERPLDVRIVGIVLMCFGILMFALSLLALWILIAGVTAFHLDGGNGLTLERQWGMAISHVSTIRPFLRLGCILRVGAPSGGCVRYVVVRANGRRLVPMPLELFQNLPHESQFAPAMTNQV